MIMHGYVKLRFSLFKQNNINNWRFLKIWTLVTIHFFLLRVDQWISFGGIGSDTSEQPSIDAAASHLLVTWCYLDQCCLQLGSSP